jgi:hypothetical protein
MELNVELSTGDKVMDRKTRSWILEVVKDPDSDDLMLEFPDEVLKALNLKVGDVFTWKIVGTRALLEKVDQELPSLNGESAYSIIPSIEQNEENK